MSKDIDTSQIIADVHRMFGTTNILSAQLVKKLEKAIETAIENHIATTEAVQNTQPSLAYDEHFGDEKDLYVWASLLYRHFDTYSNMSPVGCKYCQCGSFEEPLINEIQFDQYAKDASRAAAQWPKQKKAASQTHGNRVQFRPYMLEENSRLKEKAIAKENNEDIRGMSKLGTHRTNKGTKRKTMSYNQVGACPQCGAPIYTPNSWMSVLPPPPQYSCNCRPAQSYKTATSIDPMTWVTQFFKPGRKPFKCPLCEGSGQKHIKVDNTTGTQTNVCNGCDGKGIVWEPES